MKEIKLQEVYYEFIGGTSAKFYEICIWAVSGGIEVRNRWGRIGCVGRSNKFFFHSAFDACTYANKKVHQRRNNGYVSKGAVAFFNWSTVNEQRKKAKNTFAIEKVVVKAEAKTEVRAEPETRAGSRYRELKRAPRRRIRIR